MYSLLILGIAGLLLALAFTPVVRSVFVRWGALDQPDDRKTHLRPVPRAGGVAIAGAYLGAFGVIFLVGSEAGNIVWSARVEIFRFLPAALVIFAVGLIDDLAGLSPWKKLSGQLIAAVVAIFAGVQVNVMGGHELVLPWSYIVTAGWLLLCTNAVNLIDGIDGLATGVGLFATLTTLTAALLEGNVQLALATTPLAGALLGFLRYNFNPASIFLGDSGSMLIGFLLGCFGVVWSEKSTTILGMTAPAMALAVPLLDTAFAIARRFVRNQPILVADRDHIHHRLLNRGLTTRQVVLVLYGFCALGAVCSLGVMNPSLSGLVVIVFCATAWIAVQRIGYREFGVVGRMIADGTLRRYVSAQLAVDTFQRNLISAETPERCWAVIQDACREFGFHNIHLEIGCFVFDHHEAVRPLRSWSLRVPIAGSSFIELHHQCDVRGRTAALSPFADVLSQSLAQKIHLFSTPLSRTAAAHD